MKGQLRGRAYGLAVFVRFIIFFSFSVAGVIAALSLLAYQRVNLEHEKLENAESLRLELATKTVGRDLRMVVADLRRLAHSQIVLEYLQDDGPNNTRRLQSALLNLAEHAAVYDQLRYLDRSGHERVRINFNNGSPVVVPAKRLQDKGDSNYFSTVIALPAGHIYLSRLDLNVENNTIETPFKPTIRAATVLFDPRSGEPAGVLMLNYLAANLLDHFKEVMTDSWGTPMILNEQGYWLYGPDPRDEWAFMWNAKRTFAQRYPQAWMLLADKEAGRIQTTEGLFSFATLRPQVVSGLVAHGEDSGYAWKIVSRVAPEKLLYSPWRSLRDDAQAIIWLLVLTGILTFLMAWLRIANIQKANALRSSEERFRELVDQAADGIFIADLDGRYTDVNRAGCAMLGYERHEIVGKGIVDFIPPEDVPRLRQVKEQILQGGTHVTEWHLRCKDGSYLPVEVSAKILPNGRWQGFVRDIRERKRTEEQLRRAATVFDTTQEAILITDAEHRIVTVNQAYTNITGFGADEVLGKDLRSLQSDRHEEAFYRRLWQTLENTGQWQGEIWNQRKNGEQYPAWGNISVVKNEHGEITNYVSVMSDISPIKRAEERLSHLAHHDALTGLPNRLAFSANLEQALERARRHHRKLALLFLDLDRFKLVNDTLGHAAGDQMLQVIADRLRHSVRAEDMAARLGGDEFTIVMEEISQAEDAALLAKKIIRVVAEPIHLNDRDIVTSASIGIGLFPDDAGNAGDLARAADSAMYRAKGRGRQTYEFYTTALTTRALEHMSIENGLRQALARNEFALCFQPQIEVATGKMRGVEALLRWRHPELGVLLPEQFIRIAEESRLIDAIGEWVLQTACAQAKAWKQAGLPVFRIAINLSGHQIIYDHPAETIRRALEQNGLRPGEVLLELEITESVLQSGEQVVTALRQLRSLGISIAIDDFGTGYSSLSHLKHLPIDTLKIDRAFLRNIPHDADNNAIATAIISMGHSLGLRVVAEGVETQDQLEFLAEQDCDEAQGFFISEAVAAEHIGGFAMAETPAGQSATP